MSEDAMVIPDHTTSLTLVYDTDTTHILREEEAYSFGSLVADCGGVLGLFIGFNFLMIWDWTLIALARFLPGFNNYLFPAKSAFNI